jgi:hypothetical protein
VKKEILVGVKKSCKFNVPTNFEFVFDHGYAGETYGVSDIVSVLGATTSNFDEGSTYQDWAGSCKMDVIIFEKLSDNIKTVNKTQTVKN